MQYKFLYFPTSHKPSASALAAKGLKFWPAEDGWRGLIAEPLQGQAKGTFIVFHGNGGTAADRDYYARILGAFGFRTILAEYPEYAGRPGGLGEEAFVADALETIRLASGEFGGKLYILGESLGSGVAAAAVKRTDQRIGALLLVTPWDTLLAAAKSLFPYMPVGWLMKDKYDSVGNLDGFPNRIAVVGAELDDIVPVKHAVALYNSLTSPKRMWTVTGAGHNDWLLYLDRKAWQEIISYLSDDQ